jgi:hypothetical protein
MCVELNSLTRYVEVKKQINTLDKSFIQQATHNSTETGGMDDAVGCSVTFLLLFLAIFQYRYE